ncbi:hypothetical protein KO507_03525 [Gilvimarinus agarilyticus]|uniref:3-hydroxyacyl-ACP dehydratase n=1 Tax=Reichenbachiella TaxID=156993 RepID=UPI000E6BE066|nr:MULTISPECIES: 3-hydroxyacyl-ACP dehydratase [Reichenbachiella]MBU2884833.1 hypothetical protein [Gilvimarinus agarilyticus]MBU2913003.1 hypothetical protein [Reichenbachiella agariperforans]RJE72873.1 hypothetical protein BGP76_02675 [Reichenbachiella sp. MSK19-1]
MNENAFLSLVTFGTLTTDESGFTLPLTINPAHEIFEGHFPEHPIVPGVVTMEILRRGLALATSQNIRLRKAANIKFLGMIDPNATPELILQFSTTETDEGLKVKASISAKDTGAVLFKQQATYYAS